MAGIKGRCLYDIVHHTATTTQIGCKILIATEKKRYLVHTPKLYAQAVGVINLTDTPQLIADKLLISGINPRLIII
jgi:hypothetical protein